MRDSSIGGAIEVADGAQGTAQFLFAEMDSSAPVSTVLDSASWACDACPELGADLNGDGWLDVYLPGFGDGDLYLNDGQGVLIRSNERLGSSSTIALSAVAVDLEGDGLPRHVSLLVLW